MYHKFTFFFLALLLASLVSFAQQIPMPQASPSSKVSQQVGLSVVTVDYSRPSTKGRKIFGELVPYDVIWRTGANSPTLLTFSTEVTIAGQKVPAGSYALYAIPGKTEWTMVLSKNTKLWGAMGYNSAEDQMRFKVKPSKTSKKYETFEITFNNLTDNSATVALKWETTKAEFKIETEVDPIVMADIKKQVIDANSTDPNLLFQSANYYFTTGKDLNQAYEWIKQSTDQDPKYWTVHVRAKIELALGMKTEALDSATKSKEMAQKENNPDYVALNERLIKSIK